MKKLHIWTLSMVIKTLFCCLGYEQVIKFSSSLKPHEWRWCIFLVLRVVYRGGFFSSNVLFLLTPNIERVGCNRSSKPKMHRKFRSVSLAWDGQVKKSCKEKYRAAPWINCISPEPVYDISHWSDHLEHHWKLQKKFLNIVRLCAHFVHVI